MLKTILLLITAFGVLVSNSTGEPLKYDEPELPAEEDSNEPWDKQMGNPILPPFGLKWGDSPEIVREWSRKKGYKRKKYQDKGKLILEVSGPFENMKFQTIRFHYEDNALLEVELEYPHKTKESDGLFQLAQIKELIESKRGRGRLEPEEHGENESQHWRLNRYTWDDGENLLWLVNFQIKEGTSQKGFQTISITSLHYRLVKKI